ncbi:MAG: hypothetical protein MPJ50_13765 [Pirellulales bacterium]|nr:hypothetical protein [Pirellulales bacterium]
MIRKFGFLLAVVGTALLVEAAIAGPDDDPVRVGQPETFRLMTEERDAAFRRLLPKVDDPNLQAIFENPRLILYTDREMPQAYQDWSTMLPGVHSPSYNISANGSEPFGNGNREFPWSAPAGTHRSTSVTSFKFLWLPEDESGRTRPVVWYRSRLPGDSSAGYAWLFPVGTLVGEVLYMKGSDGRGYTFEVRVRNREEGAWGVDVFRPFPEASDLAEAVKERRPDWADDEQLAELVAHLESKNAMPKRTLADDQPGRSVFRQQMGVDKLPPMNDTLVAELLTGTVFKSALADYWRIDEAGLVTFAPTTDDEFHVVPKNYDAGFIQLDRDSCLRCHQTVAQSVRRFDVGRDWYGRIRGSDGIFSFHPFAPSSISSNGYGNTVRMRDSMERAGVLERFDPEIHTKEIYQRVKGLVQ